ncbi:MAG TPA: serine/threonine-protein kinase [Pyrinomonadaceae bacterium]
MRECPKCGTCYEDKVLFCEHHPAETKQTLPGTPLLAGRYCLKSRLGRGAMGQVYVGTDENFGTRKVAVKTVRPDLLASEDLQEGEAIARFEREARAAASIQHPHVVATTDFGKTEEGVFYLVMEYVKGETLHDLLRREGTLTTKRALNLLKQIGDGVEAAHQSSILHRDLKPANIFLLKTGNEEDDGFIKVGDFGLAKIVDQAVSQISAKQGPASRGIIGTPEFMAPEQMESENPVDARADVYALGTIAYLMLGGRVPFTGDLMKIISSKFTQDPPPLSQLRTDLAPEIERAVMHALEREPAKRPTTVSDWLKELSTAVRANPDDEEENKGGGRLVILAPIGAEVYVDDERKGSIGSSGRMILASVPPGRHVLRVARRGERDDERVIEIREDSAEQVIQAVLKQETGSQSSPSQAGSGGMRSGAESVPDVVVCTNCGSRFAAGVRFCGRCGSASFRFLHPQSENESARLNNQSQSNQPLNTPPHRFVVNTNQATHFNCPRCNKVLPVNARFCGGCGLNLAGYVPSTGQLHNSVAPSMPTATEAVCRKCGSRYPAGVRFCGRCGSGI